jgi:hypothetical protein
MWNVEEYKSRYRRGGLFENKGQGGMTYKFQRQAKGRQCKCLNGKSNCRYYNSKKCSLKYDDSEENIFESKDEPFFIPTGDYLFRRDSKKFVRIDEYL